MLATTTKGGGATESVLPTPVDNYSASETFPGDLLNDFFTFDLSSLNLGGSFVTKATLELVRFTYAGTDPSETIGFYDVSTPAATPSFSNVGTNATIFADLGSGTNYGNFVVPAYTVSTTETLLFVLNSAALADISAAAGGFFSIGGSVSTITIGGGTTEGLFISSIRQRGQHSG